ncbi:MAG: ATP-binding protein [Sandaracinaceae bacterium]
MLVEFRTENHRSIRTELALTLEAGRVSGSGIDPERHVEGYADPLLPVVALYGANASGKSNVLAALAFMRDAAVYSHRSWEPEGGVPREPFAWGDGPAEPSLYEITAVVNGTKMQYGFVADNDRFIEEWLRAWPKGRPQLWFERDGDRFKFGEHLKGENRVVEQVTRPNALFLSAAAQHGHPQLTHLHRWFLSMHIRGFSRSGRGVRFESHFFPMRWLENTLGVARRSVQQSLYEDLPHGDEDRVRRANALRDLVREADVGIVDIRAEKDEEGRRSRIRISLQHQTEGEEAAWLGLEEESQGTFTLLGLAPFILDTIETGGVMVVDELEASLHPLLTMKIVSLFNEPKTNPKNAQLLFTTHTTHLLGRLIGNPVLRRDQVWLTEKNRQGETCVYPLTDFRPRKSENVERGYLQGRYGAIPFLGDLVEDESVSETE